MKSLASLKDSLNEEAKRVCTGCGSSKTEVRKRTVHKDGETHQVWACKGCSMLHSTNKATKEHGHPVIDIDDLEAGMDSNKPASYKFKKISEDKDRDEAIKAHQKAHDAKMAKRSKALAYRQDRRKKRGLDHFMKTLKKDQDGNS